MSSIDPILTDARPRTSLVVQCVRHHLPMQGVQVQPLVGELRSICITAKNQHIKQKQCCSKFKMIHIGASLVIQW